MSEAYYNLAIEAALAGGKEILEVYSSPIAVQTKDDNSPLTEADKRAHLAIKSKLDTTSYPTLSEEGKQMPYSERKSWETFWLVDPLDGTKEFIKRNGEFTVNIALIKDNLPVFGVIYAPVVKSLYVGIVGIGAWKVEDVGPENKISLDVVKQSGSALPKDSNGRAFTVVASRSHFSDETKAFVDLLKKEHSNIQFASMGSSLKICLVAEGQADVYPRFAPTMEWDTGAGHAIAKAAGKLLIDHSTGEEMRYNRENLLNNWFIIR